MDAMEMQKVGGVVKSDPVIESHDGGCERKFDGPMDGDDGIVKKKKSLSVDGGGVSCRADFCTRTGAKPYLMRHKVCEAHASASVVIVDGTEQRFCQQCGRFHELLEFDEGLRSCRRRLARHNERRRPWKTTGESQRESPSHKGTGAMPEPQMKSEHLCESKIYGQHDIRSSKKGNLSMVTRDENNQELEEETEDENNQELEEETEDENNQESEVESNPESEDGFLVPCFERDPNERFNPGRLVLRAIPKGDEWEAQDIRATVCKPVLPASPNCLFLVALSLEESKDLMDIPSSFFENMPALKRLNLSNTSIRSLPLSLFKVDSLKELILRHCKLFMALSPQVGQLYNLEELDLDETQIVELPKEIGKLSSLKILRLSLDKYINSEKRWQQNVLIHPGTIKSLSQLIELKIDVNPENEEWNAVEEVVVEEVCSLDRLKCLILYLPNAQILGKRRTGSSSLSHYPLHRFRFTIGQHRQHIISRVPKNVEAHFQEWDKCLKFVKCNDISSEMKRVVGYTKALYLERHATARSLCDFGIKNIEKLEFCLLTECNEIQTIIDSEKPYEEGQINMVEDEATNYESKGGSYSSQQLILLNLQHLYIYYLKNLGSIWRTPTNDKQRLSGLKVLELHVCPKLSVIFSPALLISLGKLEVLVVEDCPELTSVVSPTSNASFKSAQDCFLPSLKMVLLLFLPKLESISCDFLIAPKLEKIGFYDCPELKGLSKGEMSSKNLTLIKGEREWWEALEWDESDWERQPDYLHSIFSPIDEDDDVMTQMEEMYESFKQQSKNGHSIPWFWTTP